MGGVGSVCTELTVWEGKTMKTAVKHCVSSAYQIGTGGGVEGRRGLAPPPIRLPGQKSSGCGETSFFVFLERSGLAGLARSALIQARMSSIAKAFSASVRACPGVMPCHFMRQVRQQQAVACWAVKTGCPFIGV